ncbi:hypothetical protein RJT34_33522 [Clitoria ternatea]|uniref:Uncharacterized protein n=1 Tax=Clitoria ternatea TaxID=43366 RepID=A0AAN9I4P7_CLITE
MKMDGENTEGKKLYKNISLISIINSQLNRHKRKRKRKSRGPTRDLTFRRSARFQSYKRIHTESSSRTNTQIYTYIYLWYQLLSDSLAVLLQFVLCFK